MSPEDVAYYSQRVSAERELAIGAQRKDVAAIHEDLARRYQALIDLEERRVSPPLIVPSPATV